MSDSTPSPAAVDLRVQIEVEDGCGPVIAVQLRPMAPKVGNARPRDRGPLGDPLLIELWLAAAARCRAIAYGGPLGRVGRSWSDATLVMPRGDVGIVTNAVRALLNGDELPAHAYLRHPPPLPKGAAWQSPASQF